MKSQRNQISDQTNECLQDTGMQDEVRPAGEAQRLHEEEEEEEGVGVEMEEGEEEEEVKFGPKRTPQASAIGRASMLGFQLRHNPYIVHSKLY
jgi:hypothetical protein